MRLRKPRIHPLPFEQWSDQMMAGVVPAGVALNVTGTIARDPQALKAFQVWGAYVMLQGPLPRREAEIVILRIGWLCRSGYEWAQHVVIGEQAGLTPAEIERIKKGADAPGWSAADAALIRAADQLHGDQFIKDPLWAELRSHFDERQCMHLVFVAGQYVLVSMALNTFGVQVEEGLTLDPALTAY
jgi:alkylhydroperoxidase family enzyme